MGFLQLRSPQQQLIAAGAQTFQQSFTATLSPTATLNNRTTHGFTATLSFSGSRRSFHFPLAPSSSGRYIVDKDGLPFFFAGDSPHSILANISSADASIYLYDRGAKGFNLIWVELLCNSYTFGFGAEGTTNYGKDISGNNPFTATLTGGYYDFTAPNSAYWSNVDAIIQKAADNGIFCFLTPIDQGGWSNTASTNGTTRCNTYGQFLGNRYKGFWNVFWNLGNDFQDWATTATDNLYLAVVDGIRSTDTNHLITVQLDYPNSNSQNDTHWISKINVNGVYTYKSTYDECYTGWNKATVMPTLFLEANYENEGNLGLTGTPNVLRRQAYWSLTGGCISGHIFGSYWIDRFDAAWKSHLNSQCTAEFNLFQNFVNSIAFQTLVPDQSHTVLTSGYGTSSVTTAFDTVDYATAAAAADGTLAVIYTPVSHTLTVAMNQFAASVRARWFDPTNGTLTNVSGTPFTNTGTHNFTPTGNNSAGDPDWVLLLDMQPSSTILKALTATLSFTGSLSRKILHGLTATLSFTGLLSVSKSFLKSLTATLSFVGSVTTNLIHGTLFTKSFTATLLSGGTGSYGVIDSYSETNQDATAKVSSETSYQQGYGVCFTANGSAINDAKWYLQRVASPTGNAVAKLYTMTGTFGTNGNVGTLLATSDNLDVTTISGSLALVTFTFSGTNQYVTTNGAHYVITFEYSGGDSSNYINIGYDSSGGTFPGTWVSLQSGSWTAFDLGVDLPFYVDGTPVSQVATLTRKIGKSLSATLSFIGNLVTNRGPFFKNFAATLSSTGSLIRLTKKIFAGTLFTSTTPAIYYTDNFDRADGGLGGAWTAMTDGSTLISSNQIVGTVGVTKGNYRVGETYNADHYSEIQVTGTAVASADWIGATVRTQASGDHYLGIYLAATPSSSNSTQIFKRISGSYTAFGSPVVCGLLSAGTKLRLTIAGGTLSFSINGVCANIVYDNSITAAGAPGVATFGTSPLDNWQGANKDYDFQYITTDGNGVESWAIISRRNGKGFGVTQVLRPTSPTAGRAHQFMYTMPVESYNLYSFGNPMDELRALGAHNAYNVTIIIPSFNQESWYANHATDDQLQYESFVVQELVPWATSTLATSGTEQHWWLGFSKSGFGGITAVLRHQDVFTQIGLWDMPSTGFVSYTDYGTSSSSQYGTDANFQANYRMTSTFFDTWKTPFQSKNRIYMAGYNFFQTEVTALDTALTGKSILHGYPTPVNRPAHSWGSGWLPQVLLGMYNASLLLPSPVSGWARLTQRVAKVLSATLSFVGSMTNLVFHLITKALTATLSFTGNLTTAAVHFFTKSLTATLSFVGALTRTRTIARALTATLSFAGAISRRAGKSLVATLGFTSQARKFIRKVFNPVLSFIGFLFRGGFTFVRAGQRTGSTLHVKVTGSTAKISFAGSQLRVTRTDQPSQTKSQKTE